MEQDMVRIKIIHINFIWLNYSISFQKVKFFLLRALKPYLSLSDYIPAYPAYRQAGAGRDFKK
jgi:hypothetical protein